MIPDFNFDDFVRRTLAEDLGQGGDVTSNATISPDARFSAELIAREPIVVAGLDVAEAFFQALDGDVTIARLVSDGDRVEPGAVLMRLSGNAGAMLAAERSALNTLQHLSGIATLTRRYVDSIDGTGAILLDTRKTIPGLRHLEKYAVRMGGAAPNLDVKLDRREAPQAFGALAGVELFRYLRLLGQADRVGCLANPAKERTVAADCVWLAGSK